MSLESKINGDLPSPIEVLDIPEKEYDLDITHIEKKYSEIQEYIINLDAQTANLKNTIKNSTDPGQKGKLFGVVNQTLEIIATFQALSVKVLELKCRYRKEKADYILKKLDYIHVKLKKIQDDEVAGLNTPQLIEIISNLQKLMNNQSTQQLSSSETAPIISNEENIIIDDDDKYRL